MVKLARSADGEALVGDKNGFLPLESCDHSIKRVATALPLAAKGEIPDLNGAPACPTPPSSLSFGLPLESFGKLWGIGLNYLEHANDLDETRPEEPGSFMKPISTLTGPGGPIRLPSKSISDRVTAEAELGVVIGRTCTNLPPERTDDVIAGYVPVIDMTAEDILEKNPRYLTRSKSFDTFLVLGPWITTSDEISNLSDITVQTIIDGDVVAENSVKNMKMKPHELVSFHSKVMTLYPGDIISTGTPGAGVIESGMTVEANIHEVGSLSANVVE
jgi:2-keto-4-pentenoate hydratase/2-oxohepta-3-ene-1,7-dioic acid hydratase in catechol pathway